MGKMNLQMRRLQKFWLWILWLTSCFLDRNNTVKV